MMDYECQGRGGGGGALCDLVMFRIGTQRAVVTFLVFEIGGRKREHEGNLENAFCWRWDITAF